MVVVVLVVLGGLGCPRLPSPSWGLGLSQVPVLAGTWALPRSLLRLVPVSNLGSPQVPVPAGA